MSEKSFEDLFIRVLQCLECSDWLRIIRVQCWND